MENMMCSKTCIGMMSCAHSYLMPMVVPYCLIYKSKQQRMCLPSFLFYRIFVAVRYTCKTMTTMGATTSAHMVYFWHDVGPC